MEWRRSTFCGETSCVEVAATEGGVAMRDGKNVEQPYLHFSRKDWNHFVEWIADGGFREEG